PVRLSCAPSKKRPASSTRDGGGPPRYHPDSRRSAGHSIESAIGLIPDALFCASARERIRGSFVAARSQSASRLPCRDRCPGTALLRSRMSQEFELVFFVSFASFTKSRY